MVWPRLLVATLVLHLLLIATVCCRDTFVVIGEGRTILPDCFRRGAQRAQSATEALLGEHLARRNPVRQFTATYGSCAGIGAGTGFFAPHVPGAMKLIFELEYPDGRLERELPPVHGRAMAFRLASLLDLLARVKDETVRDGLMKYLSYAVWRQHSDVVRIRAIFGTIDVPPSDRFDVRQPESYRAQYVYDFTAEAKPAN